MTEPRRLGGRPVKRTDRWYALLALIYTTADELSRRHGDTGDSGSRFPHNTGRSITASTVSLAPNTVTNALTEATKRDLFTRLRHGTSFDSRFRPRNASGGRLTDDGWRVLGPVSTEWRQSFGRKWKVIEGEHAREAILLLVEELRSEELRAQAGRP